MTTLILALTGSEWIGIAVGTLVAALLIGVVVKAFRPRSRIEILSPSFFFPLAVLYLVILLVIAVLYDLNTFGVQDEVKPVIGNVLPIGVPWFGALGAVLISLQGVFWHNQTWDRKWNYWHLARPIFGAVLGIVAFFIFVLILRAAGTSPGWLGTAQAPPVSDLIVYYVLAFLVGYREENFSELVKRATDLIFKPGGLADVPTPAITFQIESDSGRSAVTSFDMGSAPVAAETPSVKRTFLASNTGTRQLATPSIVVQTLDPPSPSVFASVSDKDQVTQHDLVPGESEPFTVSFRPTEEKDYVGEVRLSSPSLSSPAVLKLSGKGEAVNAKG